MHRFALMSTLFAFGLGGYFAAPASAVVLYDSKGFEAPNFTGNGSDIMGQGGTTADQQFHDFVYPGAANSKAPVPNSGVFTYANLQPTDTNRQFATVSASSVASDGYGYFYPQANFPGVGNPYTPAAGEVISIRFTMFNYSGYTGNGFVGVSAFNSSANEIGSIGINATTGTLAVPASGTVVTPFTAAANTTYNYQLVLDYALQQVRIYTAPNGTSTYTLNAFAPFANASTDFSDADLATFAMGGTSFSDYAAYDNYSVVTLLIPEPASLAALGVVSGLLVKRRRRTV